jgi:Zn-dependent metalloprotease
MWVDRGGVHINSGIPNHAFYLLATAIGGNAWDVAGKIWYNALRGGRLGSNATFVRAAEVTIQVANELFTQSEAQKVENAWKAVKVI